MSPIKQELLATIADAPDAAIEPTLQFLKSLLHAPSGPRLDNGHSVVNTAAQWPDEILNYQGDPDFPAFESYRNELLPLSESILF